MILPIKKKNCISFHYVSCVNKTTCYKICKQNASTKRLFLFCFFYFYFFVVYKIIKLKVDLFVDILLKYWSCLSSVRCLHSINYKKRQQNCTRMQSNIITFYNWNCLGFYVEDTICEMEHDSKLKFNTCKLYFGEISLTCLTKYAFFFFNW
jgi:hypothetical protein